MPAQNAIDLSTIKPIFPVLGGKGGIGKSLLAQILATKSRETYRSVFVVDTDHSNNSTRSIDPDARMLDIWDVTARGGLAVLLAELKATPSCAAVIDTGAQEDAPLIDMLEWLAREAGRAGACLVPVLPLSLSTHTQRRAVEFAAIAARLRVPVVFVRNLGQGRTAADFAVRWGRSRTRAEAIERGAVETELPDAGARWADEAGGYGLSLADVALGRWAKAGSKADEAAASFDASARAWLNIYLDEAGDALTRAIGEAIAKRRRLDAGPVG